MSVGNPAVKRQLAFGSHSRDGHVCRVLCVCTVLSLKFHSLALRFVDRDPSIDD